jgi:hypothetical protein
MKQIVEAIKDTDSTLRPIAIELKDLMQQRIHEQGLDSFGNSIGTYKQSYLDYRKKRYGLNGSNVVLILTNKMFQSWTVEATARGWAVGFLDTSDGKNVSSLDKMKFAEEHFGTTIGQMTEDEENYANERLIEITNEVISRYA